MRSWLSWWNFWNCGSFCRQDANAKPLKKYKEFSYLKPGWDCAVKNKHNWFTKNDNKNFKFFTILHQWKWPVHDWNYFLLLFWHGGQNSFDLWKYCNVDGKDGCLLWCKNLQMLSLFFCLIIPLSCNFHEWPRQNFSLQYQYNTNQISDENKEKYQFGDN